MSGLEPDDSPAPESVVPVDQLESDLSAEASSPEFGTGDSGTPEVHSDEFVTSLFEDHEIGSLSTAIRSERMLPAFVSDVGVALPETNGRMRLRLVDLPERSIDIPISLEQASALSAVIAGIKPPRPLANALFCEILLAYDLVVEFVAIVGRNRSTFLAELTLNSSSGRLRSFPCRPSDGVLLALTQNPNASILIDELLMP